MSRKKWKFAQFNKALAADIASDYSLDELAVLMLNARGMTDPEEIADFLSQDGEFSDPFEIKDMDKAAEVIRRAVDAGDRITVYGDYDADGVTATALLLTYLLTIGADADYYIPSRIEEGYGLNKSAADTLLERGTRLIVTVDNGISAVEETKYIKSLGMDIVITDHHQPGAVLPDASAVVDPHRADDECPFDAFAGVGVAFKLICALEDGDSESVFDDFADLAVIGTIADIVPLKGENRLLVSRGLDIINNSQRPGINALRRVAGLADKSMTAPGVAFSLAPRINAAGRVGEADTALRLLITEDEQEAQRLAEALDECNQTRQKIESEIVESALAMIDADPDMLSDRVIVASGDGWHAGVIGIVASRLVDKYGKPAIVIAKGEDEIAKGSCRSIEGFSLFDALTAVKDKLVQFGGHTLAAGFSVRNDMIGEFRVAINEYAQNLGDFAPVLNIDCRLNPAGINNSLLDSLALLEPFGAENPQPLFALKNLTVTGVKAIGATSKHVSLTLEKANTHFRAVWFGMREDEFPFRIGENIDIAVNIEKNEFRGEVKPSVMIRAAKLSGCDDEELFRGFALYDRVKYRQSVSAEDRLAACPDRQIIKEVFRAVRSTPCRVGEEENLTLRLSRPAFEVCRVRIALDALIETGVLAAREGFYTLSGSGEKVSLMESDILRKLGYTQDRGEANGRA